MIVHEYVNRLLQEVENTHAYLNGAVINIETISQELLDQRMSLCY
jgi:hypothetical protein